MSAQGDARSIVGRGVVRKDVVEKLNGSIRYTDDLDIPTCWHGRVIRSPVSHGKLLGLDLDPAFDWSQVCVTTAEDIPGTNVLVMHDRTMPLFAEDEVLYKGEPLGVVAAPTKRLANEALAHIYPRIEELPAVLDLDELVEQFKRDDGSFEKLCGQTIVKGDVDAGLAAADRIVEREYTAGYQEQLYLEPQSMIAVPGSDGGVLIEGSMQCPYYVVHELHEALGLTAEQLRVKQAAVGGAFGGKEEFPSMLAGYCAVPAMKSGHPVKIVYDRHEDILCSTKRHPSWVHYRVGLMEDGSISAIYVDYLLNGGAYLTLSDVVMYRGILHAAMGYKCDHVYVNGVVGRTHMMPSGAFRGFGAPQAIWALESLVDELAELSGVTPDAYRLEQTLEAGDLSPTGQRMNAPLGGPLVLKKALEDARFREQYDKASKGADDASVWRGIGIAYFAHGAGFTGDGEAKIKSRAAVDLEEVDGKPMALIRVSSTEMGQGSLTALSQMAAEGLSVDFRYVSYPLPDTGLVPNSGPTVASRTTMVVGSLVYAAGVELKSMLESFCSGHMAGGKPVELGDSTFRAGDAQYSFEEVASAYLRKHGTTRVEKQFMLPDDLKWNQETFEGDAYPDYSWGCNIAEVEIDPLTLEIKVPRVYACFDIGRVINPVLAEGQIEGGLTQALGYAVMEKMGERDGHFDADRMQTYVIPTILDTPDYRITFIECPYEHAAPGAKGVGEIPMDGLAPAIANAVKAAAGVRLRDLPLTPEALYLALQQKEELS